MRRLQLGEGDAEAVNKYFSRMHKKIPQFYHSIDLDDEGHLWNVFWADARSRAAYESFSDAVCFDSTYLTNKYDMPFAPFVGVNLHDQSILLGCGLLSSETKENYVWLFKEWLGCMSGSPLQAIIDKCASIGGKIDEVFSNIFQALCRWHIMRKVPEKFNKHCHYDEIRSSLENCLYQTLTIDEFEECWRKMISTYEPEDNVWLNSLHEERE